MGSSEIGDDSRASTGPGASGTSGRPRSNLDLLRDPSFRLWFWGNVTSNTGSWLFNVTAVVIVFELSRSAVLVGLVSVAQFATLVLFSPWAGALSDRLDRRRVLIAAQLFSALAAAGLAVPAVVLGVEGLPGAWPVLLSAFGIGLGKAFSGPAANSIVPALVDDSDLEGAVSLTQLTFNVGRAMGPVGAGVLLVTVGPEIALLLNAVSFLVLVGALLVVDIRPSARTLIGDRSVRAGLRYVKSDRPISRLLVAAACVGFAADPVMTLAPPMAEVIAGGAGAVPLMVSGFGVMATLVAFSSPRLQRAVGSNQVAGIGLSLLAIGLVIAATASTTWVATAGFAVNGAGFGFSMTSISTMLQRRLDEDLRGRVMALWMVSFLGTRPFASIAHGAAADAAGPRTAMAIAVVAAAIGASVALTAARDEAGT